MRNPIWWVVIVLGMAILVEIGAYLLIAPRIDYKFDGINMEKGVSGYAIDRLAGKMTIFYVDMEKDKKCAFMTIDVKNQKVTRKVTDYPELE